ncbi:MAG: Hpt domain-containing protein [Pseudomonadota bacterium]
MDRASLEWVQADIEESLRQARTSLETFADDPAEGEALRVCADTLHGVRGVLEMLEVYGVSLLFDEMGGVIDGLMAGAVSRRDDACEVLMHGIVQVPEYLDFLARGNRDNAVVLMPLLNDIRSVRGMPLLSENSLFAPELDAPLPVSEREVALVGPEFQSYMRKLRPYFQRGLVGWYRGDDLQASFQLLDAVVLHVEKVIGSSAAARLWWIARAVVQSLKAGGIDHSVSLKLLMGQLDRQLKRLCDAGVEASADAPPEDLLKNLLYYVARSSAKTRRAEAVRKAFRLDELIVKDSDFQEGTPFGPNLETFNSVSVAVKESLARIRDALDAFSRQEAPDAAELTPLLGMMQEVADTLGLLGLGIPRRSILEQRDVVDELIEAGTAPTNDQLMDIAGVVLGVEATMDALSEQGAAPVAEQDAEADSLDPSDSSLTGIEYLQLVTSVIGEIKTDLAVVKDAIATFLDDPGQRSRLEEVPRRVEQVVGGMRMLYLKPAAELMERWMQFVDRVLLTSTTVPDNVALELLADGVESIEYYLESVANARADAEDRLAGAELRIDALPEGPLPSDEPAADTSDMQVLYVEHDIQALRGKLSDPDGDSDRIAGMDTIADVDTQRLDFEVASAQSETDAPLDAEEITMFDVYDGEVEDPEFADIEDTGLFAAGSAEATPGGIGDHAPDDVPAPAADRLDDAAIAMAEAGAYARSDRVEGADFDGEVTADLEPEAELPDSVAETLAHAQSLLQRMDAERAGAHESVEEEQAAPPDGEAAAVDPASAVEGPPAIEPGAELDPEILEIFLEEAEEVLAELRIEIPRWRDNVADNDALTVVRRSFHTLKGSGRLVGAVRIGEYCWTVENLLNRVIDGVVAPDERVTGLIGEACETLPSLIAELRGEGSSSVDIEAMAARTESLAAESATQTGRSVQPSTAPVPAGSSQAEDAEIAAQDPGDSTAEILAFPLKHSPPDDARKTSEPAVREVFIGEAQGHLDGIEEALSLGNDQRREPQRYIRAMHTLTGGARASGFAAVAALGAAVEGYLATLAQVDEAVDEDGLILVAKATGALRAGVEAFQRGGHEEPPVVELDDLVAQAGALSESVLLRPRDPSSMTSEFEPSLGERLELREGFLEEAGEILDTFDSVVNRWRESGGTPAMIAELQRCLHTLKGGARLVQAAPLGDLSHALETAITRAERDPAAINANLLSVVEVAHDRIADMLDCMVAHQPMEPATELIEQINAGTVPVPLAAEPAETLPLSLDAGRGAANGTGEEAPTELYIDRTAPAATQVGLTALEVSPDATSTVAGGPMLPSESASDPDEPDSQDTADVAAAVSAVREAEPSPPEAAAEDSPLVERAERIQVDAELLDNLVGYAGEISISQSRIELQVGAFRQNLDEMNQTVVRLREQLRRLELETESQILYRHERESSDGRHGDFDPLELDRFSRMQELSRGLAESVGDLGNIQDMLDGLTRESETILVQQARTNTDLQHGLMQTRMLPFERLVPRFRRVLRQTARELGKQVRFEVDGDDIRIDRAILNRMVGPLEHIFRNAADHGIETPDDRSRTGKGEEGVVRMVVTRDGPEVELRITDDGRGVSVDAVRSRAIQRDLLAPGTQLPDAELLQIIFEPAFTTSRTVTQISGRGVGLDVVQSEVKQLGGSARVESSESGAAFIIRLPLTLAINQALMVGVGPEELGLPLSNVDAVLRIPSDEAARLEGAENALFEHDGAQYPFIYLGTSLGVAEPSYHQDRYPVILIRAGENRMAVRVDELRGRHEVVVKSVGPMLSAIRWVSGATIMGDGRVVLILDAPTLVRMATALRRQAPTPIVPKDDGSGRLVMVVDDSITVRKVTGRFLQRNGMQVVTAKDGLEALALLQDQMPDVMLLDIEMPRMDGFELATTIRNDNRMAALPIIMITSRTGEKHTDRARQIGIDRYLGKPYHEGELLDNINALLTESRRVHG